MARILLSAPWTWSFGEAPRRSGVAVFRRSPDWEVAPWRARAQWVIDAVRIARDSAGHDCVVLATVGAEAAMMAALVKLRSRRTRVAVFDFLAPRTALPCLVATRMFACVDRFLVIRSGDAAMLRRRFGVPSERVSFLAWPLPPTGIPEYVADGEYVYSAGWAHRDWDTLTAALDRCGLPAMIAPGRPIPLPEGSCGRIEVIDMPPPARGRELTAHARVVAVSMVDTDLPSGPLVLLDALAMGKAVVASDVNGTRDYVRDGETAVVVPPGDAAALADALRRLWDDDALRRRLGSAARADVLERCALDTFWERLAAECR